MPALLGDADLSFEIGERDHALANVKRAESVLRQLIASYPDVAGYRNDLASTIRIRVRLESESGRVEGAESRLREAASIAESVVRDDPDHVTNMTAAASVYSDLGAVLGRLAQPAASQSAFSQAFKLLDEARRRSPQDKEIRARVAETLVSHAECLAREHKVQEALEVLLRMDRLGLGDRDRRRLFRTLSGHGFDSLLGHGSFKLLMMDLAFPGQAFARPEGS